MSEKKKYKVSLRMNNKTYAKSADTIDEGLKALELTWNQIKNKAVVRITKGRRSYDHLFYVPTLKRIFANKIVRGMWAKRLELLLKASNHNKKLYL